MELARIMRVNTPLSVIVSVAIGNTRKSTA